MSEELATKPALQRRAAMLEVAVVLGLLPILLILFLNGPVHNAIIKGRLTSTMCAEKQLYLAAAQMANDSTQNPDPGIGWPAELVARGKVETVSDYIELMIEYGYVRVSDLQHIVGASVLPRWDGMARIDGAADVAFKFYRVGSDGGAQTLFMATRNFRYGNPLDDAVLPGLGPGFAVVRMGGDGGIYNGGQVKDAAVLGLLPGRMGLNDRPREITSDTLIQK